MDQKSNLDIHFFEFKHFNKSLPRRFKLRISILSKPIPEEKMIKGSQPLAEYHPQEFRFTNSFYSNNSTSPNEILTFDLRNTFNPMALISPQQKEKSNKFVDIVVELFLETTPDSLYAKTFPLNKDGYINIGHNIVRINSLSKIVHEPVQVVFDEVLFCSVGLIFHLQSDQIKFKSKLKKSNFCKILFKFQFSYFEDLFFEFVNLTFIKRKLFWFFQEILT
jgi:hypothetical protein